MQRAGQASRPNSDVADRRAFLQTAALVVAVLIVLFVSRRAATSSPAAGAAVIAPQIQTSPAGGLTGPGLTVDSSDLDSEHCLTVDAGSSVITEAGTDTSSVWVFAGPGDLIRVDYDSVSTSESRLIPQQHLDHEFAPGRVTVTIKAGDPSATVRFTSLSEPVRVCGLTQES